MKLLGKYKNGNYSVAIFDDGTKMRISNDDEFIPDFAENCDIKITNCCDINCPMCHEASCIDGKHGDILNLNFFDTLHPYTEAAIGGGNALSHPDLIPFLRKLKERKVIANLTVNQIHFEKEQELIKRLIDEKLIYGLGVSLVNPTPSFISIVSQYDSIVIHTINGLLTKENLEKLAGHNLKLLILGYKDFRKGSIYLEKENEFIKKNQQFLYEHLNDYFEKFKLISFDNLALAQLDVKRFLSKEEWDEFYMGDDGTMTFYIDAVEEVFASSSISNIRYPIKNNIDEMFKVIKGETKCTIQK